MLLVVRSSCCPGAPSSSSERRDTLLKELADLLMTKNSSLLDETDGGIKRTSCLVCTRGGGWEPMFSSRRIAEVSLLTLTSSSVS